ncbi:biopolymer transporter ExbD [Flavitalea sp. BT771]|uniref:ExbD/TolR family protein n=1 Tax=Flavitalea sp. BT771 TaxID=3063329 RepID=UPI0026E30024|nr:biopolymer transporter ExbD [Flavitalea sp. BT771]MDO6433248.1 biopolymer transporter ExbD [Flavitalea sp. BT771]MDV6221476.1 biopolymer transporter ExbD [Flavitalea sp. BT771]
MAEMDTSSGGGHKKGPGVKKGKKLSTRVDLTPMVDLGFLLITFFIFTTTMSSPTAMKLNLPKDTDKPDEQNKLKESAALTVMPSKANYIYYYEGLDPSKLQQSDWKKIRDVILDKKRRTDPKDFMVIIKPTQDATYKNTVDMLDEMKIDDVKRYALVDITPDEYKFITATEQANGIK